jgi:hypothetical protein
MTEQKAERPILKSKHLLDKDGDRCRFPHWEGNRLVPCGKPGYPYCLLHQALRWRIAEAAWARCEAKRLASLAAS